VARKARRKKPPVGMVVTDWFNLSLYRIAGRRGQYSTTTNEDIVNKLVFPAASRPNINNLISLLPKILPEERNKG
jgi:hypothetical protein